MIVTYEDRADHLVGIKLLVLSLAEHWPDAAVEVLFPTATANDEGWFQGREQVRLRRDSFEGRNGYNIKPSLLRRALEEGAGEAIWMDSDIIVNRDPRPLWADSAPGTIVVAEEFLGAPHQGGSHRTRSWGLEAGRRLPNTTNSCVVRVTREHLNLLRDWDGLLASDEYQAAQKAPWHQRPPHMAGDQDVLCALLGSNKYRDVPIRWIRRGSEVAHCFANFGYPFQQRISNLMTGRSPTFLHGQGPKPWHFEGRDKPLFLEVSPYFIACDRLADKLGEQADWRQAKRPVGRWLRRLFGDHLSASGLLPAALYELKDQRMAKTLVQSFFRGDRRN